ncbi:metal ABC transporter solute-binding protein, Zn/Mn family [Microbacterium telephonicum]|uniref:Zinc/manganese transport system substrate-binding protein n=1 Tax=Microbacterium telephonicum TaxID=1714841 RepID=A0A498C8A4_9MICO|nr:zinc ABC transporter substrate-binding protein [Microbacterium telephonicum]RLK52105.1 zinc/manganese transport system substrate-binding protein [Microbacterium telephonicum]
MTSRVLAPAVLLAASVLALAGCAGTSTATETSDGGKLSIVASTNVYGDIAAQIGGDLVEVTSIISSASQDPHEYEASAQDQLTLSKADLVIENGGGYDAFVDSLLEASGTDAPVVTAVEYSHDYPGADTHDDHDHADETDAATAEPTDEADDHDHEGHDHIEGFNEHVWYDPHTIAHVAEEIAHELGELDSANAATYEANYETFAAGIEKLEASLADIESAHAGAQFFVTEPVPVYLLTAAGLVNATPEAFSEAVEEGRDVPPATLLEAQRILGSGDIAGVIVNAQTGGAETDQVIGWAGDASIPVLEFSEILPDGDDYFSWMQQNIDDIAGTLTQ